MYTGKDQGGEAGVKRLRLRAWRRGTREMDLILGPFADRGLAGSDQAAFEALLACDDPDIEAWFWGRAPVPEVLAGVIAALRRFHGIGV